MSAVRLVPDSIETVRFLCKDSAKTLSICPPYGLLHKTLQMYEIIRKTALIFRVLHLKYLSLSRFGFFHRDFGHDILIFRLAHIELRAGVEVSYASSQHGMFNLPEHSLVGTNASQFLSSCKFPLFWILHRRFCHIFSKLST